VTAFGIRSIRWTPDSGFFLNGRRLELKGTDDHQDHAGVGVAVPDGLWDYRIHCLKDIGANAYRCAHNPPSPELLDACDRLGMLVIDENRWMALTPQLRDPLRRMILRDRNHPSIIAWSIGNEEWAMEGTPTGARIASTLQDYVHTLDTTRPVTAAISGGWGNGISTVIQVMGYNYIAHGSTDEQHRRFPWQPGVGTEEGQMTTTRGVYVDDPAAHRIASYDRPPLPGFAKLEDGWKHYAARPYLAGMFIWSGFDYRGEPSPFGWPSVSSYTGVLDACGFPKDIAWYFRSWWTEKPVLHLFPHWNWPGREGRPVSVWAYSNCDEVVLFLNGKSQGRRQVPVNGHVEWTVAYRPGVLKAVGYRQGRKILTDLVQTTGQPAKVVLQPASSGGVTVVTVKAVDAAGLAVPVADNEVTFRVDGPARIIGVGNGDPVSHEADQYVERVSVIPVADLRVKAVDGDRDRPEVEAGYTDKDWSRDLDRMTDDTTAKTVVYRGNIELTELPDSGSMRLYYKSIGTAQQVFLNGRLLGRPDDTAARSEFVIDNPILRKGNNVLAIVARPLRRRFRWDEVNHDPGVLQIVVPGGQWKRRLFNGLAQVIVEPTGGPGVVTLTAGSKGLQGDKIVIK
jgi:beta-galactosidase